MEEGECIGEREDNKRRERRMGEAEGLAWLAECLGEWEDRERSCQ